MPKLCKHLETGASLYIFSDDLIRGCRHYSKIAKKANSDFEVLLANTSSILMGGSVIEAKLNELCTGIVNLGGNPNVPINFWNVLHAIRKDMKFKDKWNLIASVSNGHTWNAAHEPFQSYDLIVSLRNELVHYKGEYGDGLIPPVKKIESLMKKFKGNGFIFTFDAASDASWVNILLTARELSLWIADTVEEFDMKFDHLLTGTEFTEHDKFMYKQIKINGTP